MGNATTAGEQLADTLLLALKSELAPLRERLATFAEATAAHDLEVKALRGEIGTLRERLAVAEARPPVPGPPGAPGADGLGAEALVATQDAEDPRLVTLSFKRGDTLTPFGQVRLQTPSYCGVYDPERVYSAGDQVTHGGSLWHCHATTRARPGNGSDGWQLQVKRGEAR